MESNYLLRSFVGDITIIPISQVDHTNWTDSLSKIIAQNDPSVYHWKAVTIGAPSVMDGSVLFPYMIQPPNHFLHVEICHTRKETLYDENRNSLLYYQFCIGNKQHALYNYDNYALYNFELYYRVSNGDFILHKDIEKSGETVHKINRIFSSLVDVLDHFSINDVIKEIVISKWGKKEFSRM
jgi:hypothetical protein